MKKWIEDELNKLPKKDGFRLRGFRMSRLETLTDFLFLKFMQLSALVHSSEWYNREINVPVSASTSDQTHR